MDSDSALMGLKSGSASRKRPFSVGSSMSLSGYSNESSEDYNILSSLGMKDKDIFKSPGHSSLLEMSDSIENFKVPTGPVVGQSPYFNMSTPIKKPTSVKEAPKNKIETKEVKKANTNLVTQKEQLPSTTQVQSDQEIGKTHDMDFGAKMRKLRPVGEYTVSSMEKEYEDLINDFKQERENDQIMLAKCSKAIRDRAEHIIQNLDNLMKMRYEALDENLHSAITEFEKNLEIARKLEEEVVSMRNQVSGIVNNILQDPGLE